MVAVLMMSGKLATLGLFKIKVFWNKSYGVIIFVHDVTNKIWWRDSNYIVAVVMQPKFGNFSISRREVIRKNNFFWGCFWFKFNNLGLALVMALKFYTSVAKGLKLKVRKFYWLISVFVEVTGETLVEGGGLLGSPILNRVKDFSSKSDQIRSFLGIWSHLLEKSSMGKFTFRAVEWK